MHEGSISRKVTVNGPQSFYSFLRFLFIVSVFWINLHPWPRYLESPRRKWMQLIGVKAKINRMRWSAVKQNASIHCLGAIFPLSRLSRLSRPSSFGPLFFSHTSVLCISVGLLVLANMPHPTLTEALPISDVCSTLHVTPPLLAPV